MNISFFEEFPDEFSLKSLNLVKFNTKLFIADYSIEGYKVLVKKIEREYPQVKGFVYWPVLNVREGYWFSPFSVRKALLRSIKELMDTKINFLYDAKLPKMKMSLIFTQFFKHTKNKKYIRGFLSKCGKRAYTVESPMNVLLDNYLFLKIDPKVYGNRIVKMLYSSIFLYSCDKKKRLLKEWKKEYGSKLLVGLGCTAPSITGCKRKISVEKLKEDLKLCEEVGVKEVVIFRLGGLNKEYVDVLEKFI